jgi:hypothetical protein
LLYLEALLSENTTLNLVGVAEAGVVQDHLSRSLSSDHTSSPLVVPAQPVPEEDLSRPRRKRYPIPARVKIGFRGCLIGGAVGDVPGASVRFRNLAGIRKRFGPGGNRDVVEGFGRVGAITDDIQTTFFTAEGLLRCHLGIPQTLALEYGASKGSSR